MDTESICPSCRKPLPSNAPKGLCPECLMKAGFGSGVAPEPGQPSRTPPFVPPAVAEVGKLFPQFEIMELLGQGGMGAVYKARQPVLDRLVALKILPPETGADPGFADRFTREARALARLSHPNIVGVHEFGQAGGLHYFVMEYVEGLNLRQVQQAGKLSSREALKIIPQICDALQFAHDEGIVHRDIKPENVMLDKKGRVKITDFGLAKILGREPTAVRLTGAKDVMGTPHYMAPEQIEHPQEVDHRADIYSLGVVFYEMLTGELPLGKFQPPSRKVQVDVRLDEVVLHALEKEPERRYQQASQVKTAVETIARTPSVGTTAAPDGDRRAIPDFADARQQLTGPALGITVATIFTLLFQGMLILTLGNPLVLLMAACNVVPLIGARRMRQLRNHRFAVISGILASLPGFTLALPFGIWALVVLYRREVREAFAQSAAAGEPPKQSSIDPAVERAKRLVKWPAIGLITTSLLGPFMLGFLVIIGRMKAGAWMFWPLVIEIGLIALAALGGYKLLHLESRRMALAGGIAGCILSFLNFFCLPFAVWSLAVASRREVREAFGRAESLAPPGLPPRRPTGAGQPAPPFFVAPSWYLGILVGLALVAGLIAWGLWERRSTVSAETVVRLEEKLARELKARVIAADFGVASVSVNIDPARPDRAECLIGGLVKFWGAGPQKPGTQRLYSEEHGGGAFRHEGGGLWSFVGNGALQKLRFHVDASAELASNLRAPGATPEVFKYSEPEGADAAANPNALLAARFGLVREVTLNDIDDLRGGEALDLDSGQLFDLPKDIEKRPKPDQVQWLKERGADMLLDRVGGRWGLMTTTDNDLKLAPLGNESWDVIAEQSLSKALAAAPVNLEVKQRGPWQVYVLATNMLPPLTFAFQTVSDATGLLQITRFTETPNSARLRYKVVQASGKTSRLEDLSEAQRARAVELFNDIEDFGHEFEAAFASKSVPAAETGTRRLLNLLGNFNAVMRGTGYEFSPGIFEDIGKVQQALKEGDWDKVQQAARHNDAYAREFKRIAARMVELAREQQAGAGSGFGPVVERVIAGKGDANKRFIDLDKGRLFAAAEYFGPKAEPSPEETQKWLSETGIDAVADTRALYGGLVGFNLVASPVPSEEWDRLPPSRLDYYLAMSTPGTPVTMSGEGELPATFAIKTREGAQGLLQIVGYSTNNPPEVRIRYRLTSVRSKPPAGQAQTNATGAEVRAPPAGK